jgi:hypothetical protein
LIGGRDAKPAVGGRGPARLDEALSLSRMTVSPIGRDLMIVGYCSRFDGMADPK